jgi:hypothetical protein
MSARRPNGRRNIAEDKIKLLITHPSSIAFALRSLPIDGRARLTAEPRKGVRNAAKVATSRTDLFDVFSSAISIFMLIDFYLTVICSSFNNSSIFKFSNFPVIPFLLYQ